MLASWASSRHTTMPCISILKTIHTYVHAVHVVSSPLHILTAVHATKVVKPGCPFVVRMYNETTRLNCLSYYTRLSKGFLSDTYLYAIGMV